MAAGQDGSRAGRQQGRTAAGQDGSRAGNPIPIKELSIIVPSEKVLVSSLFWAGANINLHQHGSPLITFNP